MTETTLTVSVNDTSPRWWSRKVMPYLSWRRTSLAILALLENKLLSCLPQQPEGRYVSICKDTKQIWTLSVNTKSTKTPLVMVHGMGSGVGLWALNLEALSSDRPLYAFDLLGFGRSSRCKFSHDADTAELEFVESIEEWRKEMKLNKFILLGHSLGGYLCASYCLRYPDRIAHLILVDPWGFPERPENLDAYEIPMWIRVVRTVMEPFNPFTALRIAGPWGPGLVARFRPDLIRKFGHLYPESDKNCIADYVYHCNAQYPSGEIAFKTMMHQFGWAKNPMLRRITDIHESISMTMLHGARSWIDYGIGYETKFQRNNSYVDVQVIREAGHHVYADRPELFNKLVNKACEMADKQKFLIDSRTTIDKLKMDLSYAGLNKIHQNDTTQDGGSTVGEGDAFPKEETTNGDMTTGDTDHKQEATLPDEA